MASKRIIPPSPPPGGADLGNVPGDMQRREFPAMGTVVEVLLPQGHAAKTFPMVRELFQTWEKALSRFQPDSELSILNARAGSVHRVSPLLYRVVDRAVQASAATRGVFDPTLLPQLIELGYDQSFDRLPRRGAPRLIIPKPGGKWAQIRLDPLAQTIMLPHGVALDLGGIAKGMTVDAAITMLADQRVPSALVNAGGDLAVLGWPAQWTSWPIRVPGAPESFSIPLRHGAVATSGVTRRNWWQGSEWRHHLLDPRTGLPAETNLLSVTVVAPRCEEAEVAAKVAYILGPVRGQQFLENHNLSGLSVEAVGTVKWIGAWPKPETSD